MSQRRTGAIVIRGIVIVLLIGLVTWLVNQYGISRLRENVEQLGIWAPIGLFALRFTSVVIPALPGTAYLILAGGVLGFSQGLLVMAVADLCSCTLSFSLSRWFGRSLVERLVGESFLDRIDHLSRKHLETNFFLLTGFLMTGFFDFVCYAVGLTKAPWIKFAPALVLSIALSDPPFVALGAGLLEGGRSLLAFALLGAFGLATVTAIIQRQKDPVETATSEEISEQLADQAGEDPAN